MASTSQDIGRELPRVVGPGLDGGEPVVTYEKQFVVRGCPDHLSFLAEQEPMA